MRCRTDEMLQYVQFLARRIDRDNTKAFVLLLLVELGFAAGNDGFMYLRRVIEVQSMSHAPMIIKGLYPGVSFGKDAPDSWHYVDQAIRRSIHAAWEMRDPEIWNLFFPPGKGGISRCPSNKEFIARMVCIVELWQSCKEVDYDRAI